MPRLFDSNFLHTIQSVSLKPIGPYKNALRGLTVLNLQLEVDDQEGEEMRRIKLGDRKITVSCRA
jgi:hypothetical protein